MHIDKKIGEFKTRVISRIMLRVRDFNEKHRSIAKVTTVLALILIVILSVLFTVAEKICSVFSDTGVFGKRALAIILSVVLLFAVSRAISFVPPVVETIVLEPAEQAESAELVRDAEAESAEEKQEVETDETEQVTEAAVETEAEPEPEIAVEAEAEPEIGVEAEAEPEPESQPEPEVTTTTEAENTVATADWDTSDAQLDSVMKEYPETVGWIYFEDGHISYPIMQSSDNDKYKKNSYKGDEAREGSIFLDHRSSADLSDYNSIIYGHNMKDGTMFGTLRKYRDTPGYYDDHLYFQVILPDKKYRYLIFAYMDVPQSYEIYDYVGEASKGLGDNLEYVRRKAYISDEIPVNTSDKVVTLSTCTDKDDLQFVILGVMVDEAE